MATVEADANLKLYPRDGFNIFYIGFNNTIPPFDNPDVRAAITYAIDRQRIVDQFYATGSSVANSFVPDFVVPGASPSVMWWDFDQAMAKETLLKAGYSTCRVICNLWMGLGNQPHPDSEQKKVKPCLNSSAAACYCSFLC